MMVHLPFNCGKAPDTSGLMAEHLVYSSPMVASVLADITNDIIQKQKIPAILKHGCITPIFKKKNSPRNPDNYRCITITLLISKVLEKILQYPLKTIMATSTNCKDLPKALPLQIRRSFSSSEAIADSHDQNKPLFTLFLDASKAFDVVYHASMLNHLHELHITGDLWVLLNDTYAGMTSAIKWKGQMSSTFYEKQGIRQGGVNSTEKFKGRGNPFLVTVQEAGIGKSIGSIFVGAPTCADDVALVADSTSGGSINRKLDCSARFGPSSNQSNLPSIARSLPSDNENKHDETAAILKDTFDRQDTL